MPAYPTINALPRPVRTLPCEADIIRGASAILVSINIAPRRRMARPAPPPEVWMIHLINGEFTLHGQEGPVRYRLTNPRPDLPPRINGIARMHREYPGACEIHTYGEHRRMFCEGTAVIEA